MSVSSTKELHERAMSLYEASLLARRSGDEDRMTSLLTQALQFETAAADSVVGDLALEPTRAILHRSAASLALQLGEFSVATRYVEAGLKGNAPDEIREELRVLLDQIMTAEALRKTYRRAPPGLTQVTKVIRRFTSSAPVNIVGLARSFGITVRQAHLGENSGEIFRDIARGGLSGYTILVNSAHPKVRKRFTVAHELGHFLRHRNRISNRLIDDKMYRSRLGNTKEAEANKLAADLLMPGRLIQQLRAEGVKSVEDLAKRFEVSLEAMKHRIKPGRPFTS